MLGFGDYGQLGDGVATKGYRKYVPGVPIEELEDVESIAVGNWRDTTLPLDDTTPVLCSKDGRLRCWGLASSSRHREYQ